MKDKLKLYLTHGYYDKKSLITHMLLGKFSSHFITFPSVIIEESKKDNHSSISIDCPKYAGHNKAVIEIMKFLSNNKNEALENAYIVGSIADHTETNYSDFDGILIIDQNKCHKASTVNDLRKLIRDSNEMMKAQDVLQHHGWMILWKHELNNYNENYLPSSIFENAKTLYPPKDTILDLKILKPELDAHKLNNICKSIELKLEKNKKASSFYVLKNLISELL